MTAFEEDYRTRDRRQRRTRSTLGFHLRRLAIGGAVLFGVVWLVSNAYVPDWLDPKAPEEFDAWVALMCERNDAIDAEARTLMPHRRVKYDPEFVAKTERILVRKRALLADVEQTRPVIWRRGLHRTLTLALRDSIRHHEGRVRQYFYTQERVNAIVNSRRVYPEDFGAVWDTTAQTYSDPDNGLHAGKIYQRLYDDIHERLGMPLVGVWPHPTP